MFLRWCAREYARATGRGITTSQTQRRNLVVWVNKRERMRIFRAIRTGSASQESTGVIAAIRRAFSPQKTRTREIAEQPHTRAPPLLQGKLLDFVMANKEPPTGRCCCCCSRSGTCVVGKGEALRRSVLARPAASLLPTTRVLPASASHDAIHDVNERRAAATSAPAREPRQKSPSRCGSRASISASSPGAIREKNNMYTWMFLQNGIGARVKNTDAARAKRLIL